MKTCSRPALFAASLFLSLTLFQNVHAQSILFDNGVGGAADIDDALQSDADPLPEFGNLVSIAADDFMVSADAEITTLQWIGVYVVNNTPPAMDEFIVRIYEDDNGPVGSPIATFDVGSSVNRTQSPATFMGLLNIFDFSAEISFKATANTTYWLSIDAQSFGDTNDTWFWGTSSARGNANTSADIGQTWAPFGQSLSLVLLGNEATAGVPGDVNCDGVVDLLDVGPFVDLITSGGFSDKADLNMDGAVDLLDVSLFVDLITGG